VLYDSAALVTLDRVGPLARGASAVEAWIAFPAKSRGWCTLGQWLGFHVVYSGIRKRGLGGSRRDWWGRCCREVWRKLTGVELVGAVLRNCFVGGTDCRSQAGVDNRKLRGGVAGVSHNCTSHKSLILGVRVDTRTNDDIGVTGLDIGEIKANNSGIERETRCKGIIY